MRDLAHFSRVCAWPWPGGFRRRGLDALKRMLQHLNLRARSGPWNYTFPILLMKPISGAHYLSCELNA
jgi:hypothetical protein